MATIRFDAGDQVLQNPPATGFPQRDAQLRRDGVQIRIGVGRDLFLARGLERGHPQQQLLAELLVFLQGAGQCIREHRLLGRANDITDRLVDRADLRTQLSDPRGDASARLLAAPAQLVGQQPERIAGEDYVLDLLQDRFLDGLAGDGGRVTLPARPRCADVIPVPLSRLSADHIPPHRRSALSAKHQA